MSTDTSTPCPKYSMMKWVSVLTCLLVASPSSHGFVSQSSRKRARHHNRHQQQQELFGTSSLTRFGAGLFKNGMVSTTTMVDDYDSSSNNNSKNNNAITAPIDLDLADMAERIIQAQKSTSDTTKLLLRDGLTKVHQNIWEQTHAKQRFVTGKDPLLISMTENPTKKWLQPKDTATVQLLVNGTTIDQSLASFDRFQWLDDDDRAELVSQHSMVSLELIAEINIKKPGYVNILPTNAAGSSAAVQRTATASKGWDRWKNSALYEKLVYDELGQKEAGRSSDRLWITGFTLTGQRGQLHSMDVETGHIDSVNERTSKAILWPNESNHVPKSLLSRNEAVVAAPTQLYDDALLISDGFLVPGKDKGGLYVVQNPGNKKSEWNVCLTGGPKAESAGGDHGWFYHRSVWLDLTGDGRKSILTARAKLTPGTANKAKTQLVWLEMPMPHSIDIATGTPLEDDGTVFDAFDSRHLPWKSHVLVEGPDVMFSVADMDTTDDTVEIFSSHFFDRKVTMHSIKRGAKPRVVLERVIDDNCGAAFSSVLANLDVVEVTKNNRAVVDSGSTVETLQAGDSFSHLLVTSHECSYQEGGEDDLGGSLFSYRVPKGDWKTEPWTRTTVASDFTVKGQLTNMINPGAPGFVYTFHARKNDNAAGKRPLIAIAGDCADSAYILRPVESKEEEDPNAQYKLMCEIECGATVGSIGIGYENFMDADQEDDYAKLYIPCYEKDKVLVFAVGSGEEEYDDEEW